MLGICERYFELISISHRNVDQNWEYAYEQCSKLVQELVPKKPVSSKFHLPWMSAILKCIIKKKQHTYKHAKKYKRPEDWEHKNMQHQTRSITYMSTAQTVFINPDNGENKMKCFWHCIRGRHQDNIGIGALRANQEIWLQNDQRKQRS